MPSPNKPTRTPFTQYEYQQHTDNVARERAKRGYTSYTRKAKRDEMNNNTPGEGALQRGVRRDQQHRPGGR